MIDEQVLIFGPPGVGKSSLAKELIASHAKVGRLVLAHDPHRQFGAVAAIVDDVEVVKSAVTNAAKARASLPTSWSIGGGDADPVIQYAMDLAPRIDRPITLVLDETVLLGESMPTYVAKRDRVLLTGRRHFGRGICPILLAQDPGVLSALWIRFATECCLFRVLDIKRLNRIADLLSVTGIERAMELPAYHYICVRPGTDAGDAPVRQTRPL